jgi:uncharacterized membrane protein HdeD (DUF308 family)
MIKSFKDNKIYQIISGSFLIIAGIATCLSPMFSIKIITIIFGIFFSLSGIFSLTSYFIAKRKKVSVNSWYVVDGIIDILFGGSVLLDIEGFSQFLPLFWVLWMFFGGISKIVQSTMYRKIGVKHSIMILVIGIADLVISVGCYVALPNSTMGDTLLAIVMGALFVLEGIYVILREKVIAPQMMEKIKQAEEMQKAAQSLRDAMLHQNDMVCPKCGRVYQSGNEFCQLDGTPLVPVNQQKNQFVDTSAEDVSESNLKDDDPFKYYGGKTPDAHDGIQEDNDKSVVDDYKVNYYRRDDDDDDDEDKSK